MSQPKTYDWRFDKPALGPKDDDVFDINPR
jgi:hypothetical protein